MVAVNLDPELGGQSYEWKGPGILPLAPGVLETHRADRHLLYLILEIPLDLRSIG
jgi:hypothetical protein